MMSSAHELVILQEVEVLSSLGTYSCGHRVRISLSLPLAKDCLPAGLTYWRLYLFPAGELLSGPLHHSINFGHRLLDPGTCPYGRLNVVSRNSRNPRTSQT